MIDTVGLLTLALQVAIGAALFEGVRRGNAAAAVNAGLSFALAVLPAVAFGGAVGVGWALSLWVAGAGVLHCLGMLGLYESVWWWDHLTHAVSAALVAALLYAAFAVTGSHSIPLGGRFLSIGTATVLATVGVGVFWELLELAARDVGERFDVEPVLVHYGWRDTVFDLGFDAVGAVVVVAVDLRLFVSILARIPTIVDAILLWSTVVVCVGSLLLAGGVRLLGSG